MIHVVHLYYKPKNNTSFVLDHVMLDDPSKKPKSSLQFANPNVVISDGFRKAFSLNFRFLNKLTAIRELKKLPFTQLV